MTTLKIGSRGSALALVQAGWVRRKLEERDLKVEIIVIKTSGDRFVDRTIQSLGGKGIFTKEIEDALLSGETSAELAFHFATFRVAHTSCATFAEAVRRATELADAGDHVLLSPGFASFDMFRNYEDRGNQFELRVQNLSAPAGSLG